MEYEQWFRARTREAAAIFVMLFGATAVLFFLLHRFAPLSTLGLFLSDLFHQILFYIGGVLALLELLVTKWLETPLEKRLFNALVIGCLLLACFQAWVDEHHNAEELIKEKSQLAAEREFWKVQSYAKDEAIRSRDAMLGQNFSALFGTQNAFAALSNKILDATKPEPMKITSFPLGVTKNTQQNAPSYSEGYLLLTNRVITPVHLIVTCDKPIVTAGGGIIGVKTAILGDTWGGPQSSTSYKVGLSYTAWTPTAPLIVTISFNDNADRSCSFNEN